MQVVLFQELFQTWSFWDQKSSPWLQSKIHWNHWCARIPWNRLPRFFCPKPLVQPDSLVKDRTFRAGPLENQPRKGREAFSSETEPCRRSERTEN